MQRYKRSRLFFPWCLLRFLAAAVVCTEALGSTLPEPPVPDLNAAQRTFLSRVARRNVRDVFLGRSRYEPEYVPETLAELTAELVVRLNQDGYLLATAAAGPAPIAAATRDAAQKAGEILSAQGVADVGLVNRLLIEIEVCGPAQPLTIEGDWTLPRAADPFVEPGVHGIALRGGDTRHRFCPTELITNDLVVSDALKHLAQISVSRASQLADIQLTRFRSVHWYQAGLSDAIVSLTRGQTLVPLEAVTSGGLLDTIDRLANYMIYRQQESGLFAYQYEPGRDQYSDKQNLVRQVGAVAAMAVHAKRYGTTASRAAADLGIQFHLQGLAALPDATDAAYIATADGSNKLGVTALLCLAMAECPEPQRYAEVRERLNNGILWLQQSSGMFLTAFPPGISLNAQEYFPGEALLALATDYSHRPRGQVLDAFHRAVSFYREYFQGTPSPAFVPWQTQAYALMARHTQRPDYAEYVFELTDWLAEKQLSASNCPWPEMWGGIASYHDGRAGVSTAAYLEGFAEALLLARSLGDTNRADRYERVVRQAARFVMQLQVRPEEAYYMRSPQDAVGGIRTSPYLNLLRIDHCQHALVGLIKARDALFSSSG